MSKWIYMVCTKCSDPSREQEFNEWYDTMHVPDLVKRVPGLVGATRYEIAKVVPPGRTGPGMPKFLTPPPSSEVPKYIVVYELDTDDIDHTLSLISSESRKVGELGRMSPLPIVLARYLYRQVSPVREKASF